MMSIVEPPSRLELETPSLPWKCSTTELRRRIFDTPLLRVKHGAYRSSTGFTRILS